MIHRRSKAAAGVGVILAAYLGGCAVVSSGPPEPQAPDIRQVSPQQARRVYRVMAPLLAAMNNPKSPKEVYIGIIDDPQINAANAGGGHFYITTGLLQKANENQLRGILAHEIAHDDLGHVAKLQTLGHRAGSRHRAAGATLARQQRSDAGGRRTHRARLQPQGRDRG